MDQEGNFVRVNDIDIYYETYGEGPPLLLLHGGFGNTYLQWKDHVEKYARHFQVYGLDARAHGKTRNPTGILTTELMVNDVLAFIEAMDLQKPFISGWSMGGITALNIAVRHSHITRGVVVGGVSHKAQGEDKIKAPWIEMGILGPNEIDFDTFQQKFPMYDLVEAEYGEDFEALIHNISYFLHDRGAVYSTKELQDADLPVLLIMGDRDYLTTVEDIVELYRLLPRAELALLPGADHSMCRTKPHLYAQLVIGFLEHQLVSA